MVLWSNTLRDSSVEMGDEIFTFESFINFTNFLKNFKTTFLKFSLRLYILIISYYTDNAKNVSQV